MNVFQVLALAVIAIVLVATLTAFVRSGFARRDALLWTLVWAAAAVAICRPQLTASAARALGIGRGADLVLYCAVVIMMVGFLMVYARLQQLRRDMTVLVRHIALMDADQETSVRQTNAPSE